MGFFTDEDDDDEDVSSQKDVDDRFERAHRRPGVSFKRRPRFAQQQATRAGMVSVVRASGTSTFVSRLPTHVASFRSETFACGDITSSSGPSMYSYRSSSSSRERDAS
jgi:hypothetical protein